MFRGNFEHSINAQGRVSLPARFRQALEERYSRKLVLVGADNKIEAYPEEAYRKKEEADMALPADDPRVQQFLLVRHNNVWEVDVDGQGRIPIPPKLRKDFGLEKEVVFIGVMDRIFIYKPDQYEAELADAQDKQRENSLVVAKLRNGKSEG